MEGRVRRAAPDPRRESAACGEQVHPQQSARALPPAASRAGPPQRGWPYLYAYCNPFTNSSAFAMDWFIWVISFEISVWMLVASLFNDAIACAFRLCFKAST